MGDKKSRSETDAIPVEEPHTETIALTDNVRVKDLPVGVKVKDMSVSTPEEAVEAGTVLLGAAAQWKCLAKAYNKAEGWMKTTKVMQVGAAGCLIQVTTQQRNPDGTYSTAEAVCFAERVNLIDEGGVFKLL